MTTTINKNDSMATIQSKISKGGTIKFAKGTYKITKQLIIPADTVIDLNDSTLQRKASIHAVFLNKVTKSTKGYNGAGNITIKNGTIEGMGGYTYTNLVTFFHSHDITISNCTFQDILCHGIELNSTKNAKIYNCKFLGYNLRSIEYSHKECIQIDFAYQAGYNLDGSSATSKCYDNTCCENIEICDCLFSKSNYRDYPYACIGTHNQPVEKKHKNIKIYNNEFHCKINPDLLQPCLSIIGMEDVVVENNKFECSRVARIYSKANSFKNSSKIEAVDGDGICKNVSIINNEIKGCSTVKEAVHQYNKSGKTNHSNITKKPNSYLV